eukprot:1144255-Pelagomonas_calceolata.AAC.15
MNIIWPQSFYEQLPLQQVKSSRSGAKLSMSKREVWLLQQCGKYTTELIYPYRQALTLHLQVRQ